MKSATFPWNSNRNFCAFSRSSRSSASAAAARFQVNVRVIAATNQDLWGMVQEKKFRADLYYRLNVFPITLPPLRERDGDIPLLVSHFVRKFAERQGKAIECIPEEVMEALENHHWPGNIRELQNFIERAVIMTTGAVLRPRLSRTSDADRSRLRSALWRMRSAHTSWRRFVKPTGWSAGRVAPRPDSGCPEHP